MSKTNQSQFAILGLLCERPMTGYDIKKEAEQSIGNFWSESYGHLYPTLSTMLEKGLIEEQETPSDQKRRRRLYAITEEGRKALHIWLKEPCKRMQLRDELLLKLYFGGEVDISISLQHLEAQLPFLKEHITRLEKIDAEVDEYCQEDPNYNFWKITLSSGLHVLKAKLAWANESINRLK